MVTWNVNITKYVLCTADLVLRKILYGENFHRKIMWFDFDWMQTINNNFACAICLHLLVSWIKYLIIVQDVFYDYIRMKVVPHHLSKVSLTQVFQSHPSTDVSLSWCTISHVISYFNFRMQSNRLVYPLLQKKLTLKYLSHPTDS